MTSERDQHNTELALGYIAAGLSLLCDVHEWDAVFDVARVCADIQRRHGLTPDNHIKIEPVGRAK